MKPKSSSLARPPKTRILVVDDHPIVREGMIRVLEREDDLTVCAQAADFQGTLEAIQSSKPELAIVDLSLGERNAIELVKNIHDRYPKLPVLVHSMHEESVYAERSLRAGAKGYIMKRELPQLLLEAIRRVLAGDVYLSASMTREILRRTTLHKRVREDSSLPQLSDREFQVFEMLGQGLQTREIAAALHLSPKTVHAHREHLKEKLGIKNGAKLVRYAIQWAESQD